MAAKLWMALLLTLLVNYVYTDECPSQCKCRYQMSSVFWSCKTLDIIPEKPIDMSVGYFSLHSEKPVTLSERVFAKLGLKGLNSIVISNTHIVSIDKDAFKDLPLLTEVRMTNAKLTELPSDLFASHKYMKKLNISGNEFSDITNFIKSPSIEEIDISNNKIKKIGPSTFDHLIELILIDLSHNEIEEIPLKTFSKVEDLDELRLGYNQISKIQEDLLITNDNLEVLYLNNNPLDSLPLTLLPSTLNLHGCKFTSLKSFNTKSLDEIENLDLSNNLITDVEDIISKMPSLSVINLSGNQLNKLDEKTFHNNYKLEKIILDNNPSIVNLPQFTLEHASTFSVHWFSCQNCGLTHLSDSTFSAMSRLLTLILSHNKISEINKNIFDPLKQLNELDLSYNEIRTIDDHTFNNNVNLATLNLAGNHLLTLHASVFKNNPNLQMLDISNCGLHQLWSEDKANLGSIHNLNVSNNRINIIRKEDVAITPNLAFIDFSGNPITCSESYKNLIQYLTEKEIQDTKYITHENIEYESFDTRAKEMSIWKQQALNNCPEMIFDEDIEIEVNHQYETTQPQQITKKHDESIYIDEDDVEPELNAYESKSEEITILENIQYAFITKLLVFVSTALMVITLVVTTTMFILKRNQHLIRPRIDNIKAMSKLKKNSGLVYQPLSEEHDNLKTPVLSRFVLPTVHQKLDPSHV